MRRNFASRNREGLTFEQWAREAGISGRSVPGAHSAWARGKNPTSWARTAFGATLVANGAMDAQQFCEAVKAMADTHGKWLSCHSGGMGSHSQVFIDFINLPIERVREKRGGGAEGSNNRMLLVVDGFARDLGEPPPGKVKLDTRISLYGAPPALSKLRGKSGTPEAIAKYVSDFISKVAAEVPGKYTHANRGKRTSRRNPPPLYRGFGIDSTGRKRALGAGPLAAMKSSTMAEWLGDRSLRSAYVVDARGNAYLSLEPRDRARLNANFGGKHHWQVNWLGYDEPDLVHAVPVASSSAASTAAAAAKRAGADEVQVTRDGRVVTSWQRSGLGRGLMDIERFQYEQSMRKNRRTSRKKKRTSRRVR